MIAGNLVPLKANFGHVAFKTLDTKQNNMLKIQWNPLLCLSHNCKQAFWEIMDIIIGTIFRN